MMAEGCALGTTELMTAEKRVLGTTELMMAEECVLGTIELKMAEGHVSGTTELMMAERYVSSTTELTMAGRCVSSTIELKMAEGHVSSSIELMMAERHVSGTIELMTAEKRVMGTIELMMAKGCVSGIIELKMAERHVSGMTELMMAERHVSGTTELMMVERRVSGMTTLTMLKEGTQSEGRETSISGSSHSGIPSRRTPGREGAWRGFGKVTRGESGSRSDYHWSTQKVSQDNGEKTQGPPQRGELASGSSGERTGGLGGLFSDLPSAQVDEGYVRHAGAGGRQGLLRPSDGRLGPEGLECSDVGSVSNLSYQTRVWDDPEVALEFDRGVLHPTLAKDLYTLPSEVLIAQATKQIMLNESLKAELPGKSVADYKQSVGFGWGLRRMGQVSYKYGYRVALARFQAWYPDLEVDNDPFTERPEDGSVPMKTHQEFDDSIPPEE
ncbi:hypothetical protein B296_00012403 [Ensete ventricosum]|uniref:Uncharacterized protein n=1 Tax=Ensete ventricosum TaxID=4639 RepID=A0A426ZNP8_ENSVE|nr:hypothetical protein B296_00012403 [Ensete ventricosum]